MVLLFYNGSEAEGRAKYKAFFDLSAYLLMEYLESRANSYTEPVVDMTQEIPYEQVNRMTVRFTSVLEVNAL
jgi:hypothetical protein